MQRRLLVVAATTGCVVVLAIGAGLLWPTGPSGRVAEAMRYLPADASSVAFYDAAPSRERLGFTDLSSDSSDEDIAEYLGRSGEKRWATSSIAQSYTSMYEWSWNFADVEWEANYYADDASATVLKFRDDLDMATVVDSFAKREYERSKAGEYPEFNADISALGDEAVSVLLHVIIVPDEQLVLAGPEPEALLDTVRGDADSLADSDVATELLGPLQTPEFVTLAVGESSCADPAELMGDRASPEQQRALEEMLKKTAGYADLHPISGHAAAITTMDDEPTAQAFVAYEDGDAAQADAGPRGEYVENAASPVNAEPYADALEPEVTADGSLLTFTFNGDEAVARLPSMVRAQDQPWAICAPA